MSSTRQSFSAEQYAIGVVCALSKEMTAVRAMLDEEHEPFNAKNAPDYNAYVLGRIHEHKVVIACLPAGVYGTNAAAFVSKDMLRTFTNLRLGLLVGIGGGIPDLKNGTDIRLGDVVVSQPNKMFGGVVQYDLVKLLANGEVERKGSLNKPPIPLLTALSSLQSRSGLYESTVPLYLSEAYNRFPHLYEEGFGFPGDDLDVLHCSQCAPVTNFNECSACNNGKVDRGPRANNEPRVHYGTIASANTLLKDAKSRDQLGQELGALCVEMEAAGLMDEYPCLVIRGICDYADSHKDDTWQKYAALAAAAFAKELLLYVSSEQIGCQKPISQGAENILQQHLNIVHRHIEAASIREETRDTRYQEERHHDCHKVLKTTSYKRFKDINVNRVPGTCQWVFQNHKYQDWQNTATDSLLWISADPGCGKSVLSKSLVDTELRSTPKHKVCYFFFKDNNEQDNLKVALCALLHQVFDQIPQFLRHAMSAWEKLKESLATEIEELWEILWTVVAEREEFSITFVLDALDECREADRKQLVHNLIQFYKASHNINRLASNQGRVKFLVTSRPYFDLQRGFHTPAHLPSIRLRGEDENDLICIEIEMVVRDRVKEMADVLDLGRHTKEMVEDKLLQMKHRTYLWLHLAIEGLYDSFQNSLCPEDEVIETVPETVADAYEKILNRVSEKKRGDVRLILSMIVGARRPLTIEEMAFTLGVAKLPDTKSLSETSVNSVHLARQIRNWCGLFVFINHSKLYLIHQTAKEFLLGEFNKTNLESGWKRSFSLPSCNELIARVCVRLLSSELLSNLPVQIQVFVSYAVEHWAYHVRCIDDLLEHQCLARVQSLYDTSSAQHDTWTINIRAFSNDYLSRTLVGIKLAAYNGHVRSLQALVNSSDLPNSNASHALVLAASYGHVSAVTTLLQKGVDARPRNEFEPNALVSAAMNGHSDMVSILLNTITDVSHPIYQATTALDMAARNGYETIVSALLDHGVNPNTPSHTGHHPLQTAVGSGRESIVKLLLERGANANAIGGEFGTALQEAVVRGKKSMVLILFDGGADPNTISGRYGTALQGASFVGEADVVQLLLDKGAKVDVKGGKYDSALEAAVFGGHIAIVQLLLEAFANVKTKKPSHSGALVAALAKGNRDIIQLLLSNGADANSRAKEHGTVLKTAMAKRDYLAVELLLKHGADVDARGSSFQAALETAIEEADYDMVSLMLMHGTGTNAAISKRHDRALRYAVQRCNYQVIQLTLDLGADAHAAIGIFSACQIAIIKGDRYTIQQMLDAGVNINVRVGSYGGALQTIVAKGDIDLALLLLNAGVDVNELGGYYGSALLAAIYKGDCEMIELLLRRGADVGETGSLHTSPLQTAIWLKRYNVAQLLRNWGAKDSPGS